MNEHIMFYKHNGKQINVECDVSEIISKNKIINQVVFGITDGLIFVKPDAFEKYF